VDFVSLHNHTTFSIFDSLTKPKELFNRAKELGQKAIAVTDHGTLAGMWDSLQASKSTGVKLIAGGEFYFVDDLNDKTSKMRHIILLAKNYAGYKNLLSISYEGYQDYTLTFKRVFPRIDWSVLEKHSDGIICLTSCSNGILGQLINEKRIDEAKDNAKRLKSIFGDDFAIELQAHALRRVSNSYSGEVDQQYTNNILYDIAKELDIECVVTTNSHYVYPEQSSAHDLLMALYAGQPVKSGNRLKYNGANGVLSDFYIKSGEEVFKKLDRQFRFKDPEFAKKCIDNTIKFSDKCEEPNWIDPKFTNPSGKELPEFPVKDQPDYKEFLEWCELNPLDGKDEDEKYLRFRCDIGLKKLVPEDKRQIYIDKLEDEFEVFEYHKFSSYMLIVMDYIEWTKNNKIPIGPGRGSCGGSIVAYLIGIHIADPIKYDLIFARFHNKEKTSFPDIDTDFSPSGRHRVLEYLEDKYGKDNVAHVSNFNTLTPKVYAKQISKAFMYGGDRKAAVGIGMAIADALPADIKSIQQALDKAPLFAEYAKPISDGGAGYTELTEYASDISGKTYAYATHAGGIIIGKRPLKDIVPLRRDKNNNLSIEYEKERAEENGLVKMDMLVVETLDVIKDTIDLIAANGKEPPPEYPDFDKYDEDVYSLFESGDVFCVFQMGTSGGTIELCKRIKPKSIEDIAIINALARPALKEYRTPYIETRDGKHDVQFIHPSLKRAFGPTLGFGLYEECLLYLAQDCAGWSQHSADNLRKMTKMKGKYPEKIAKWRQEFIDGCIKTGVGEEYGTRIWDEIVQGFGGYGFNKSHAIFYSFIGYQTAWFKTHYRLEFLVANLKSESKKNSPKSPPIIAKIKEEIRAMGVKIIPPDVNKSEMTYKIIDDKTVMTGFDGLKFVGKDAIPEIIEKRPFTSIEDFLTKVDGKKVRSNTVQALAASGSLDSFGMSRRIMFLYASDYKKKLTEYLKRKKKNPDIKDFNYPWPKDEQEWSIPESCALERRYIGESLCGDKFKEYGGFFTRSAPAFNKFEDILPMPPTNMSEKDMRKYTRKVNSIQAEVVDFFEFKIKKEDSNIKGQTMCRVTLEDPYNNRIVMACFPDGWDMLQSRCLQLSGGKYKIQPGVALYLNCNLSWYGGELSLTFEELCRFSSPPQIPEDLVAKKVSLPRTKKEKVSEIDRDTLLDQIEEDLIDEGNSELEEYNDDDDDFVFPSFKDFK